MIKVLLVYAFLPAPTYLLTHVIIAKAQPTHTHTHTHTYTTHMHTHIHTHMHTHIHTHAHTHTHTCTHTYTHVHTHIHTYAHTETYMCVDQIILDSQMLTHTEANSLRFSAASDEVIQCPDYSLCM